MKQRTFAILDYLSAWTFWKNETPGEWGKVLRGIGGIAKWGVKTKPAARPSRRVVHTAAREKRKSQSLIKALKGLRERQKRR